MYQLHTNTKQRYPFISMFGHLLSDEDLEATDYESLKKVCAPSPYPQLNPIGLQQELLELAEKDASEIEAAISSLLHLKFSDVTAYTSLVKKIVTNIKMYASTKPKSIGNKPIAKDIVYKYPFLSEFSTVYLRDEYLENVLTIVQSIFNGEKHIMINPVGLREDLLTALEFSAEDAQGISEFILQKGSQNSEQITKILGITLTAVNEYLDRFSNTTTNKRFEETTVDTAYVN